MECAPLNEESIAKKKIIMPNAIEWKSVDRVDMEGEEIGSNGQNKRRKVLGKIYNLKCFE